MDAITFLTFVVPERAVQLRISDPTGRSVSRQMLNITELCAWFEFHAHVTGPVRTGVGDRIAEQVREALA